MFLAKDVKVAKRIKRSTFISKWTTYWFRIGDKETAPIYKENGVFKFFAKNCKTLEEAKQYIADFLNEGNDILAL